MQFGELRDQGALEAGFDVEDLGDDGGKRALGGLAVIDNVEDGRIWFGSGKVGRCWREAGNDAGPSLGGRGPRCCCCVGRYRAVYGPPFRRFPERPRDVFDVHSVDSQVFGPQPFQLAVLLLVYPGQTEGFGDESRVIFAVDVCETEDDEIEARNLGESFFGFEFTSGELEPRFEFIVLFSGRAGGRIDHPSTCFHEGFDSPSCCFPSQRDAQGQGS